MVEPLGALGDLDDEVPMMDAGGSSLLISTTHPTAKPQPTEHVNLA